MARPLRIRYEGAYYHVMHRGRNHKDIFYNDGDHKMFLSVLKDACMAYNVQVIAYCLMSNHYHLLVKTPDANLSQFMRQVNGVYTQRFNRKYFLDGSLFRGRFKSIVVQEERYLLMVIKYIHRNPLEAHIVKNLKDYQWSSHHRYLKFEDEGNWLVFMDVLKQLAKNVLQTKKAYIRYINEEIEDEINEFYSQNLRNRIFGEDYYVDQISENHIYSRKYLTEIPEAKRLLSEKLLKKISHETVNMFNIDKSELFSSRRGRLNIPRQCAISLSKELSGMPHKQIAEYFHLGSYKTINKQHERMTIKRRKNRKLDKIYQKLMLKCSQVET